MRGRTNTVRPAAKFRTARPPTTIPSARQAAERRNSIDRRPPLENPARRLARPTNALAIVKNKLKQNAKRYAIDEARLRKVGGFVRGPRISPREPATSSSSGLAPPSRPAAGSIMPTRYSDATSSSSPKVVLKASAAYREPQAKRRPKSDEQKCTDAIDSMYPKEEGQLREKRVHPRDHEQKPDTFDGYLAYARLQRFRTDEEAVKYAEKMWKESLVHFSSDIPEGP